MLHINTNILTLVWLAILALWFSNKDAISVFPIPAAKCNGVNPSYSIIYMYILLYTSNDIIDNDNDDIDYTWLMILLVIYHIVLRNKW